jgi:hypothetical protein
MEKILKSYYQELCDKFQKTLSVYFTSTRFIDETDKGKIEAHITDINNNLNRGIPFLDGEEYDELEGLLKDISGKCISIVSLCNPRIDAIANELIAYEYKFREI